LFEKKNIAVKGFDIEEVAAERNVHHLIYHALSNTHTHIDAHHESAAFDSLFIHHKICKRSAEPRKLRTKEHNYVLNHLLAIRQVIPTVGSRGTYWQ
jgi:hypothetical protein